MQSIRPRKTRADVPDRNDDQCGPVVVDVPLDDVPLVDGVVVDDVPLLIPFVVVEDCGSSVPFCCSRLSIDGDSFCSIAGVSFISPRAIRVLCFLW